ncbi:hypothetical protein ACFYKX_07725 [Cytobacillus sp. FJAT-54145]|uniref:tRNA methyltransferase 5a/b N-terminal domain-containing protein n=1 Tax=Cytobacillus spartinae TaxID=3299023 RepID=A0ABW6K8J9_9BACI
MVRRIVPSELKKQSKSIHLEKWVWDFSSELEPCRSAFVKELIIEEIRRGLMKEGLVDEDTRITKEHGDLYLNLNRQRANVSLRRVSSFE